MTMLQQRGTPQPAEFLEDLRKWTAAKHGPDTASMHKTFAEFFRRPEVREEFQTSLKRFAPGQPTSTGAPGIGTLAAAFADPIERRQQRFPNFTGARADLWTAMLDNGFNPGDVNSATGRSALHGAAEYAPASLVEAFLSRGGDPRVRDADGRSVMTTAVRAGNFAIADLLTSRGVEDDAAPMDRLLGACLSGNREQALALVAANPRLLRVAVQRRRGSRGARRGTRRSEPGSRDARRRHQSKCRG